MKYEIKNRLTGKTIFSSNSVSFKACLEIAVKNKANLFGANLSGANLSGANLSGADLFKADLFEANLSGTDLFEANLSGADLFKANLSEVVLSRANLFIPIIKNIHQAVYNAASKNDALEMSNWHTCKTTHSRAGLVVALAGKEGEKLEGKIGCKFAALAIYRKSSKQHISQASFF